LGVTEKPFWALEKAKEWVNHRHRGKTHQKLISHSDKVQKGGGVISEWLGILEIKL